MIIGIRFLDGISRTIWRFLQTIKKGQKGGKENTLP